MAVNPQEFEKFLGHTFVTRQRTIALQIGSQQWTRWELANVFGLPHFRAAGALTTYLRREGIKTLEQLYALDPDELAAVKGVGETAAYVAASVLQVEKFDAKRWAGFGPDGAEPVTFRTLKNRKKGGKRNGHGRTTHTRSTGLHGRGRD